MWKTDFSSPFQFSEFKTQAPKKIWNDLKQANASKLKDIYRTSKEKSWNIHKLWPHFDDFAQSITLKYQWFTGDRPVQFLIHNLSNGFLRIRFIKHCKAKHISYTDDNIKDTEVIWSKSSSEGFNVGRVLFIVKLEVVSKLFSTNNQPAPSPRSSKNDDYFFFCNNWLSMSDEDLRGNDPCNLHEYWKTIPIFQEQENQYRLVTASQIMQKLAIRHFHSLMPDTIWNTIWREGTFDLSLLEDSAWRKRNEFVYNWALELMGDEVVGEVPFCGVRKRCASHRRLDCEPCRIGGGIFKSECVCTNTKMWVALGIPQGMINKFTKKSTVQDE